VSKPRHPVTVESDLMTAISRMTGLTWSELEDREVIWFLLQGMRPVPRPFDDVMSWYCAGSCEWSSGRGRGGSKQLKEAVRQHLRDKHGKVQPLTRVVDRIGGPVIRTER